MQKIGGGQPLSYTNPNAYEPSYREGSDLLEATGSVSRPAIPTKGGFVPSVMGNLVQNAPILVPLATTAAYRMLSNKTRKLRGGTKDWETLRYEAKRDLSLIGKASAININRLASIRKRGESNAAFIEDFTARKTSGTPKSHNNNVLTFDPKPAATKKAKVVPAQAAVNKVGTWQQNRQKAKVFLSEFGKPSGPNIASYASMVRKGQNTGEFLTAFKSRVPQPKAKAVVAPIPVAVRTRRSVVPGLPASRPAVPLPLPLPLPLPASRPAVPLPRPALVAPNKKVRAPRKEGAKGVAWRENRERAKEYLSQFGTVTGTNMARFASIRRRENRNAEEEFLTQFKSRPQPTKTQKKRKPEVVEVESESESEPEVEEVNNSLNVPPRGLTTNILPAPRRRTNTESTRQWELNRRRAKDLLQRVGSATAAEISQLASMMRRGTDTSSFLNSVRTRVSQTKKRVTTLKQKKQLSAVQEVNENANEVEEYTVPNSSQYEPLPNSPSAYKPPRFVPPAQENQTRRASTLQNFRQHLQLLKQKLQREKV